MLLILVNDVVFIKVYLPEGRGGGVSFELSANALLKDTLGRQRAGIL